MSFLGEIKRRKVFQVAAVYAVMAWLIIQIIDVVSEPLSLPDWLDTVVIILLAVGFPIAVVLAWAFDLTPEGVKADSETRTAGIHPPFAGQRLNSIIQGLVLLAVGFLVFDQYFLSQNGLRGIQTSAIVTETATAIRRLAASLVSTGTVDNTGLSAHPAISPNGEHLVYAAEVDGSTMLYHRRLDQFDTQPIPRTEFAQFPTFSPDGLSVAFVADPRVQKLTTVDLMTGRTQQIADSEGAAGVTWGPDDQIIFASPVGDGRALFRVSALGGISERIDIEGLDAWPVWPHYLPGGESILFTARPPGGNSSDGNIGVLSLESGEYEILIEGGYNARYLPTGHIIFARESSLWAASFDLSNRQVGTATPVIEDIQADTAIGGVAYSVADDGTLVYVPRQGLVGRDRQIVFLSEDGTEEVVVATPRLFERPRLSPDGRAVAVDITESGNRDIFVYDIVSGRQLNRLTIDPAADSHALWAPNGESVYFYSNRRGGGGPYFKAADGSGSTQPLSFSGAFEGDGIFPQAFTPNGDNLIIRASSFSIANLGVVNMVGERTSRVLIDTPDYRGNVTISPDGSWIAYVSNEGGPQSGVWVRSFPDGRDVHSISPDGGSEPVWSSPGNRLFYRRLDEIMVAELQLEPTIRVLDIRPFASFGSRYHRSTAGRNFDVEHGGERVLVMKLPDQSREDAGAVQIAVVQNWISELVDIVPPLR